MNLKPEEISSVIKEQIKRYASQLEVADVYHVQQSAEFLVCQIYIQNQASNPGKSFLFIISDCASTFHSKFFLYFCLSDFQGDQGKMFFL